MSVRILSGILLVALMGLVIFWNVRLPENRPGDFKKYIISTLVAIVAIGLVFQFVIGPAKNDSSPNSVSQLSEEERRKEQTESIYQVDMSEDQIEQAEKAYAAQIAEQRTREQAMQAAAEAAKAEADAKRAAAESAGE